MADYLQFWRADGPVFLSPVAGAELFVPASLAPGLARLELFCRQNQALLVLTGESGTGKSTLLRWLFDRLDADSHELLLIAMVRKEREGGWLTPRIAELMGSAVRGVDLAELIRTTAARFDELIAEKRKLIVAIDAAQFADTPEAFTEVEAFLNLQAFAGTCLSFVLCGDLGLAATVAATPALATRAAYVLTLPRLSRDETEAYLAQRCERAGLMPPFEPAAVDLIHAHTRGVFALVNGYAENCLVEAAHRGERRIGAETARAAAAHVAAPPTRDAGAPLPLAAREGPQSLAAAPNPSAKAPAGGALGRAPDAPAPLARVSGEPAPRDDAVAPIKLTSLFKADPGRQKR